MNSRQLLLNVGGQRFETTMQTVIQYPQALLARTFAAENEAVLRKDAQGYVFFDRSAKLFEHVLNFYRSGSVVVFNNPTKNAALREEFLFWNIDVDAIVKRRDEIANEERRKKDEDTAHRALRDALNRLKIVYMEDRLILVDLIGSNARVFLEVLRLLTRFDNQILFVVDRNGFSLTTFDARETSMLHVELPVAFFLAFSQSQPSIQFAFESGAFSTDWFKDNVIDKEDASFAVRLEVGSQEFSLQVFKCNSFCKTSTLETAATETTAVTSAATTTNNNNHNKTNSESERVQTFIVNGPISQVDGRRVELQSCQFSTRLVVKTEVLCNAMKQLRKSYVAGGKIRLSAIKSELDIFSYSDIYGVTSGGQRVTLQCENGQNNVKKRKHEEIYKANAAPSHEQHDRATENAAPSHEPQNASHDDETEQSSGSGSGSSNDRGDTGNSSNDRGGHPTMLRSGSVFVPDDFGVTIDAAALFEWFRFLPRDSFDTSVQFAKNLPVMFASDIGSCGNVQIYVSPARCCTE